MPTHALTHPARLGESKEFISRTVFLEPKASKQLALGSYSIDEQLPEFALTTAPDIQEDMGASFERLDIPGTKKYVAFYHLHNFSDAPCEVTITKKQ